MADVELHDKPPASRELGHEPGGESLAWVLTFAGLLVLLAVIILAALWWMFQYYLARKGPVPPPASVLAPSQRGQLPPAPRLEGLESSGGPSPRLQAEQGVSQRYGWVDRKAGVVRIPVEEAMDMLAGKLPSRPAAGENPSRPPEPDRPGAANSGRTVSGGKR